MTGSKVGPLNEDLLEALSSSSPLAPKGYLDGVTIWSKWRIGYSYLDAVLTFAMTAGIRKAILFVDQMEDFAPSTSEETSDRRKWRGSET